MMLKLRRSVLDIPTPLFRNSMMTSTPHALAIPEIYQSHPSRPLPSSLSNTTDPTHQVPPHIGVVVAFLSPHSAADVEKIRHLQDVRERWDQAYARWLPHITLIPPFTIPAVSEVVHESAVPESATSAIGKDEANESQDMPRAPQTQSMILNDQHPVRQFRKSLTQQEPNSISQLKQFLEKISTTLSRICSNFSPHTLKLDDVGTFKLRDYTNVHLRPSSEHKHVGAGGDLQIVLLQKALAEAFAREGFIGGKKSAGPAPAPVENRAARRQRERVVSASDTLVPTSYSSINGFPAQDSEARPARMFSRPHYRFGGVDEARCVTLPTVELEPPSGRDDGIAVENSGGASMRGEVTDEARHVVPTPGIQKASGTNENRASPNVPSHATSEPPRNTQRPTKSNERQKFKPHASVGQARGPRECGKLIAIAKAVLKGNAGQSSTDDQGVPEGIECWIDKVYLLTKPVGKGGPYELYSVAHLRG